MATISGNGIKQGDLVDLLVSIRTKWLALLAKLDADGTVNGTGYLAAGTFAMPGRIQTVGAKAIDQGDLVLYLQTFITKFNAVLAVLDLDSAVSGTNFASLWALTDVVGDDRKDSILDIGLRQSAVVKLLKTIIAKVAGLNAKLDADSGVADTNYAATCNVTDNVDSEGTVARP